MICPYAMITTTSGATRLKYSSDSVRFDFFRLVNRDSASSAAAFTGEIEISLAAAARTVRLRDDAYNLEIRLRDQMPQGGHGKSGRAAKNDSQRHGSPTTRRFFSSCGFCA